MEFVRLRHPRAEPWRSSKRPIWPLWARSTWQVGRLDQPLPQFLVRDSAGFTVGRDHSGRAAEADGGLNRALGWGAGGDQLDEVLPDVAASPAWDGPDERTRCTPPPPTPVR